MKVTIEHLGTKIIIEDLDDKEISGINSIINNASQRIKELTSAKTIDLIKIEA